MLRFFKSTEPPVSPTRSTDEDPKQTAGATPSRPTGQFSTSRIRTIFVLGIAGTLFFIIATNKTTPKTSAQRKEIQDTATAARNSGGAMATRNYATDVTLALKPGSTTTSEALSATAIGGAVVGTTLGGMNRSRVSGGDSVTSAGETGVSPTGLPACPTWISSSAGTSVAVVSTTLCSV